jgi:hypothetical protein
LISLTPEWTCGGKALRWRDLKIFAFFSPLNVGRSSDRKSVFSVRSFGGIAAGIGIGTKHSKDPKQPDLRDFPACLF